MAIIQPVRVRKTYLIIFLRRMSSRLGRLPAAAVTHPVSCLIVQINQFNIFLDFI